MMFYLEKQSKREDSSNYNQLNGHAWWYFLPTEDEEGVEGQGRSLAGPTVRSPECRVLTSTDKTMVHYPYTCIIVVKYKPTNEEKIVTPWMAHC
jgi:hypothetical protein